MVKNLIQKGSIALHIAFHGYYYYWYLNRYVSTLPQLDSKWNKMESETKIGLNFTTKGQKHGSGIYSLSSKTNINALVERDDET